MDGTAIACSADGHKIIVGGYDVTGAGGMAMIFSSTNSGNTWVSNNVITDAEYLYSVASSADGTTLIACSEGYPYVFTSTNSGSTWATNNLPNNMWDGVGTSADGTKLAVTYVGTLAGGLNDGGIYFLQTAPSPQLNSSLTNGTIAISWLIPSTDFILQQSSDLTTWSDVTNTPVLNLTNLQNQVTLPMSAGDAFYRLAAPEAPGVLSR
jgi:hypothetical protein